MLLPNGRLPHPGLSARVPPVAARRHAGCGDGERGAEAEAEESGGDESEGYVGRVEGKGFVDGFASERRIDGCAG